jgi:23S rRNA pseudouridine2605 synthase/23S rRNA pseudouridine2604 synthase
MADAIILNSMTQPIRLQKYLSEAGVCSRRKGEVYILNGRIKVNGQVVKQLGTKVLPGRDIVEVDGRLIQTESKTIYIALHKPRNYVTTCRQPGDQIVLELIQIPQRIYPIGRLDKDSTGLLLLTNDGRLHHRLSHPSFDHEKEYEVTVNHPIASGALKRMSQGLSLMGQRTRPAKIARLSSTSFRIILQEGKNRQIRRMVRQVGNQVVALKRIRIASVYLGRLKEGQWRYLKPKEQRRLLNMI